MPEIPINQKPFSNVDDESNTVGIQSYIDFEKDDYSRNRFRPGLGGFSSGYFCSLGTSGGVDGVFYIPNRDFIAVFSNGKLFKVFSNGASVEITGAVLNIGVPVSYADFGDIGFFCNNSKILKWTYNNTTCSFLTDADAPTNALFVGFMDQYLLALPSNSSRFEFSDVDDPDTWLGEFVSAESRPDRAISLYSHFGEIFIPGSQTLEWFVDTGDSDAPFQRIPGAVSERGSMSPYSFCQIDNSYFFLDSERRVIRLLGRQPQVISNPYDDKFQSLSVVGDAIGYHYNPEGATKYILHFPTAKKTYVYDYKLDYWAEYSYYNAITGTRENYLGRVGQYIPHWNKYISGSRQDGRLFVASRGYVTDFNNDIIPELVTGRLDWGTSNRKTSRRITIKLIRGLSELSRTDPYKLMLQYRDDGSSVWSNEYVIDLGDPGDEYTEKVIRRLGQYRNRQYRVKLQGAKTTLIAMAEDVGAV